jgi:hypothetical protein
MLEIELYKSLEVLEAVEFFDIRCFQLFTFLLLKLPCKLPLEYPLVYQSKKYADTEEGHEATNFNETFPDSLGVPMVVCKIFRDVETVLHCVMRNQSAQNALIGRLSESQDVFKHADFIMINTRRLLISLHLVIIN